MGFVKLLGRVLGDLRKVSVGVGAWPIEWIRHEERSGESGSHYNQASSASRGAAAAACPRTNVKAGADAILVAASNKVLLHVGE